MTSLRRVRSRHGIAFALAAGLGVLSQLGCEDDATRLRVFSNTELTCGEVECPSGAHCGGSFLKSPADNCENAQDMEPRVYEACRIGSAPTRPGALHEGFAVGRLPSTLQRTAAGTALLWEGDDRARFVACAVFGCQPELTGVGNGATIANYSACVLAEAIVSNGAEKVELASATPRDLRRDCGRSAGCARYQVDSLTLGCWMYDSHSIVAATELAPLLMSDVSEIPELAQLFSQTCEDPIDEGRACERADEPRFGTCFDHKCRRRCMTILECTRFVYRPPTGDAGGPGTMSPDEPDVCSQKCVGVADTGIGVCMARGGN